MSQLEQHLTVNDTPLFVRRIGAGDPVLVIHGGPGLDHTYLLPYLDRLSSTHELIYFDQRYCGKSGGQFDPEQISIDGLVQDIEELRKALGFERVILLAHSFGAHLAQRYLIAYPDHVAKLVIISGLPASWVGIGQFVREFLRRTKPMREQLEEISESKEFLEGSPATHAAYYRLVFSTYCHTPGDAERLQLIFTAASAKNGALFSQEMRDELFNHKYDLHDDFTNLKTPVLVIHGVSDPLPPATAQKVADSFQNGEYVELDECGHFPYMEKTDAVMNSIQQFLVKVPTGF